MLCQICLDKYNIYNRVPRNLSCGHTFCSRCLTKIGDHYEIECPKCRQRSLNNLPICYAIYDKILLDDKSDPDLCCELHEFEKIGFYCNDDDELLCPICLTQKHSEHSVCLVRDKYIARENIQKLNKWRDYFVLKRDEYDYQKNLIQNAINESEDDKEMLLKQIECLYNDLSENYDIYKSKLLNEIEEMNSIEIKRIKNICIDVDKAIEDIDKLIYKKDLENDSFYTMRLKKDIHQCLEKIVTSEESKLKFYEFEWSEDVFIRWTETRLKLKSKENLKSNIFIFPDAKDVNIFNYDIKNDTFSTSKLLVGSKHEFLDYSSAVQISEDTILISGGCNYINFRSTATNKTFISKLISKNKFLIKEYIPMNLNRFSHGSLMINGIIYVIGGHNGRQTLASMECLRPHVDYFEALPDMNLEKEIFAYCAVKDRYIFTFGGFCEAHLDIIERYDIVRERWKVIKTKLKFPMQNSTAINVKDENIVLIGGYNYNLHRSISILNLNTFEWSEVDYQMKIPRRRAHCYLYEDKVYIFNT
jgi:hypothetical protein